MDHPHFPWVRPPDDFDTVVHKITDLLTWWTQMGREGVPRLKITNLIDDLTHVPLARATTAPAMYKEFDALTQNLQILLELHRELKQKGFSVQGIQQSIRILVEGPLTRAAIGPDSTPMQSVDKAPKEATNAEASTGTIRQSPAQPVMNVAPIKGKVPKEATTAEASTGIIRPSPAQPATSLLHIMDEAPNKATNADALTEAIHQLPSTESDGLITAPSRTTIPVIDELKHPKQSEITVTAVVGPDDHTNITKHPNQTETTANAVVESNEPKQSETTANAATESDTFHHASTEVNYEIAQAQWMSDIAAEGDHFRYTKETKQWKDVDVEPAYSQEVQRDSRLRRFYNDIAPGPKIEEVAPSGLAIDNEGFEDIPQELKQAFKKKFYNNLSYIQAHCVLELTGKASAELRKSTGSSFKGDQDALVISNTASGKTEAMFLTLIIVILENKRLIDRQRPADVATPTALVLVPTRTLVEQIFGNLIDTIRYTGLRAVAIYGGTSLEIDVAQLGRGCDVMVATPGRLIHLLEDTTILEGTSILSLCNTRWFIIDEADAMLAPSFGSQLSTIQKHLPQQHNVWLFTTALREDRVKGALDMLDKDHVLINEGTLAGPQSLGLPTKAVSNYPSVRHDIIPVTCDEDKLAYLFDYFQDETVKITKVLILARNSKTIGLLHRSLRYYLRLKCLGLSQNYAQRDREIALTEFIRGITIVLISSFQLTSGLDLIGLKTIFVHDMPQEFGEYLTGVQRVAQFDTGIARVFFNVERDVAMACPLSNYLRAHGQVVPEWLHDICDKENPANDAAQGPVTQQPTVSFSLFGPFTSQILSVTDHATSNHTA